MNINIITDLNSSISSDGSSETLLLNGGISIKVGNSNKLVINSSGDIVIGNNKVLSDIIPNDASSDDLLVSKSYVDNLITGAIEASY